MKRRERHTGPDALPAHLMAYEPDPLSMSAAVWEAGYEAFQAARRRWADDRRVDVEDLPPYRVRDAPFDPSSI